MNKVKWGILGTGAMAAIFAEALKGCEDAELYAAASRNEEKAALFAEKYGFGKSIGGYELLAADPEVDIIYIATPMSSHYDDTMMCLRRGKKVLCEKSAALNSSQLDDMITLAKEKKLFFMEAMWTKCRPSYRKAKQWAESGRIGKMNAVKADFCNIVPYDGNSRLFRSDCGGGALLDLGVYPITLAADFLGNYPCEIKSNAVISRGVDISDSISLVYPNGAYADISAGFVTDTGNRAAVLGSDGFIIFEGGFVWSTAVTLYDKNGTVIEKFDYSNKVNGYEYEIEEVHECISEGLSESSIVKHCDTLAVMKIMDTCRGQWGLTFPAE